MNIIQVIPNLINCIPVYQYSHTSMVPLSYELDICPSELCFQQLSQAFAAEKNQLLGIRLQVHEL